MNNHTMQKIILMHVYITQEGYRLNSNGLKTIFRHTSAYYYVNMCITIFK